MRVVVSGYRCFFISFSSCCYRVVLMGRVCGSSRASGSGWYG